jgi:hypothetical protein
VCSEASAVMGTAVVYSSLTDGIRRSMSQNRHKGGLYTNMSNLFIILDGLKKVRLTAFSFQVRLRI